MALNKPWKPVSLALWDHSHCKATLDQGTRGWSSCGCRQYLGEHGFAVLGDHGALVTVQRDEVVVEGLLGVLEHVVELCGPSFKDAAEVTGNQSPADRWSRKRRKIMSVNLAHTDMPWGNTGRGFPSSRWLVAAEVQHPACTPLHSTTASSLARGAMSWGKRAQAATHCISLVHPPSRK